MASAPRASRYDANFILNMSSAVKIEWIVDKVKSLAAERFPADLLPPDWFRSMMPPPPPPPAGSAAAATDEPAARPTKTTVAAKTDRDDEPAFGRAEYYHSEYFDDYSPPTGGGESPATPPEDGWRTTGTAPSPRSSPPSSSAGPIPGPGPGPGPGTAARDYPRLPFLPFRVLLITGTAGAGKTSSIQVLAANLNCVVTGTTVIAAQNLSFVLHRSKSALVKTIYRVFGFNSKHVSIAEGLSPAAAGAAAAAAAASLADRPAVERQQLQDLYLYWPVIRDIVERHLDLRDRGQAGHRSELCESNVIVIDECGLMLRYMLHAVVFFYYFYNAVEDTPLYRQRRVPCLVCVGSPTQTEALETSYDNQTQNKSVRRGLDVLSALISDAPLVEYCRTLDNWVMFINNKRCTDLDFSDLLKYIEFGLPLTPEHIEYIDRFVRPPGLIRDPAQVCDMTRLFISHAEVKRYFKRLHDQLRLEERERLFELPVYCLLHSAAFEEYCELSETSGLAAQPELWFRNNVTRIINYSQFVDHNTSDRIQVEQLVDEGGGRGGRGGAADDGEEDDFDERAADTAGAEPTRLTLLTMQITYIRHSSVGVNSKMRICVIGYSDTFERFVEVLQRDIFIDRISCEQAIYAYSLLSGLLYSAMYLFYTSPFATLDVLRELAAVPLPYLSALCSEEAAATSGEDPAVAGEDRHDIPCLSRGAAGASLESEISDLELLVASELYTDRFFTWYAKPPPTSQTSFEEIVQIYTVFRDIFVQRFQILQRASRGQFGRSPMMAYNRRNVHVRRTCEIASYSKSFVGMLAFASPVDSYTLEGFTKDEVVTLTNERARIHPRVLERGLPRLVLKDALGFVSVLESNVSKFVDSSYGKSLHICTTFDHGITSRAAMTIAKSQGLSLGKVAIDFGDDPRNLRLSQIYVAMSRVTDPDQLIMNLNPMRLPYERNTYITPYICRALKNRSTLLIF
ncbi:T105 [Tupaiid betaherpesvirus 1]|uniref:T105 n=1 Tax=Tupaiid herpesvirus 1 (strain 1) TaxID=10397 RepID=Q91TJ8_TUHV1|nr:T105 [Tupaiid betaherpesvirus 1]AAK57149.1 T105 [Tupaiid betaherpesvirus 1]